MIQLPNKPSKLIKLALDDLERSLNQGHKIDMSHWMKKGAKYNIDGSLMKKEVCTVCLAGAVMANTCNVRFDSEAEVHPDRHNVGSYNENKLLALNDFRGGNLEMGLSNFYDYDDDKAVEILDQLVSKFGQTTINRFHDSIDEFANNETLFILQMSALAEMFKEIGY